MPAKSSCVRRAVLAVLITLPGLVQADAVLRGRVTDAATNRPLPSAEVRLVELGRSDAADSSGEYALSSVPPGTYTLRVSYVGYEAFELTVEVPEAGTLAEDVRLAAIGTTEEIVVTGFRAAQATALQDKRTADVIKEAITADDAGKLPDQNAAEALRRVPGVTATVDQGEGRYVTVRGIDPSFTNITLDNQIIGSPEDTRRVALDTIPSEILSKLEVVKAVTPDMDGNSIGGSINIVTPSAFDDPDGRFFSATADVGYYDMNGENPYGVAVGWGQAFGAEQRWGLVLSGSYSSREYESENLQGGDPWVEEGSFLVPDSLVLRDYRIERIRKGLVANLEFQPTDTIKLYLRNLFNQFEDTELQAETVWDYRGGDLVNQTATSGTFTEGEGERLISERLEKQSIQTSSLGGEFILGNWTLNVSGTYGEAEQDTPRDREWSFTLSDATPMSYDTSELFFSVDGGPAFHNADSYEFNEYIRGGQILKEEVVAGQFDLRRDFIVGDRAGYLKFGAKQANRDKMSDQNLRVFDGFEADLLLTGFTVSGKSDFYSSERRYEFGPKISFPAVEAFFDANRGGFERSDADTIAESFGVDFTVSEDVTAGYVMGLVDIGRATLIGGVRVERTEADFTAFDIVFVDGDVVGVPTPVAGQKDYTNTLPSLHLRFAQRDDLILRAAWTNTIGRPSYETTVPFRVFEIDEDVPGVFEGEIERGNPDLEPLESMNFDVTVEWYLESAGILSAGVFYKDIDNPIFTRFQTLEDTDFEGRFFSELIVVGPENAESGDILGIELNYQQQFRGLPAPWNGLGVAVNYTYTDSEADIFDRNDTVPFFLQSDHIGNAALFYERSGFEARIAYTYYSRYLDAVGETVAEDLYLDARGQLDFKASYAFTDHVDAFVEMLNITDEPLRFFSGENSRRLAENEIYSWNAVIGVQVKF